MVIAYGVANLLQSVAASRTKLHTSCNPKLLMRLASQRVYLYGVAFQIVGFLLAFVARRDLPLFLVQSAASAGLGVTAVCGVLILRWKLPKAEVGLLALLFGGLFALVISAKPATAHGIGSGGLGALLGWLAAIAVAGVFAARLHGAPGSVALGSLAGMAFSAAAVAGRPLASSHSIAEFVSSPLLYVLIGASLLGQLLIGLAMQRGSTTAAVASMDAAAAVPAAAIGLLFLGDKIYPGREWVAALGFFITLAAVIGLTRYAEPQHHHATKEPARPRALTAGPRALKARALAARHVAARTAVARPMPAGPAARSGPARR
ncbi:hypothetical protein O7635_14355 [Asanoa sp. WMMD1127]|uniref:hypothetical protein n=1 Tax=Asanoa sp. WMMD1127 TaxID=3016107 RepID=UPI002415CD8B|nr:hypothetical protein [Asanoa sp. WMMD1127]MDG4823033.1 hypothetical protein [Asanoa sp. WMMD1127]